MSRFLVRLRFISLSVLSLLAFLVLSVSPLLTSKVGASSVYDAAYQNVDHIYIAQNLSGHVCTQDNIDIHWADWVTDPANNVEGDSADFESMKTSFLAALNHGSWAVSQEIFYINSTTTFSGIRISWAEDSMNGVFTGTNPYYFSSTTATDPIHAVNIYPGYTQSGGSSFACTPVNNSDLYWAGGVDVGGQVLSESDFNATSPTATDAFANYLAANLNVTYPSGYDGIPVRETPPKIKVYPTVNFSTDKDNNVDLTYDPSMESIYNLPKPDFVILTLEDSTPAILTPDVDQGSHVSFKTLPDGNYTVHEDVAYLSTDVNNHYEFLDTQFVVTLNHKAFSILYDSSQGQYCSAGQLSGPTSLLSTTPTSDGFNCSISQPADPTHTPVDGTPSAYTAETCDLTHITGCVDDFFYSLGNYFGLNGAPASNQLLNFGTSTFGLASVITAPIALLTSIGEGDYTCSAISLTVPMVGGTLSLPCMTPIYTAHFGAIFTLYQTVAFGLIAYYVWVQILHIVKDFKDPKKDQIEVLSL